MADWWQDADRGPRAGEFCFIEWWDGRLMRCRVLYRAAVEQVVDCCLIVHLVGCMDMEWSFRLRKRSSCENVRTRVPWCDRKKHSPKVLASKYVQQSLRQFQSSASGE